MRGGATEERSEWNWAPSSLVDTGVPAFLVILPGIRRAIVEEYGHLRGEAGVCLPGIQRAIVEEYGHLRGEADVCPG